MFNKKTLALLSLVSLVFILAGCGSKPKTNPNFVDAYQAAQEINKDSNNAQAVDSERNVNNIITMMNFNGNESDMAQLKVAVKQGIEDGKNQGELNKTIITASAKDGNNLGTGYMLGYTFGCKAVTGDEEKCSSNMGQQYQKILLEEMQKQIPPPAPVQ
ncbi:MAG: hypothetical protein WC508_03895 [Patescibacteria group bacterium]